MYGYVRLYNSDQRCPWCGLVVHSVCLWSLSEALEVHPAGNRGLEKSTKAEISPLLQVTSVALSRI